MHASFSLREFLCLGVGGRHGSPRPVHISCTACLAPRPITDQTPGEGQACWLCRGDGLPEGSCGRPSPLTLRSPRRPGRSPEAIRGFMSDRAAWMPGRQTPRSAQRPCIIRLPSAAGTADASVMSSRDRLRGKSMYSFFGTRGTSFPRERVLCTPLWGRNGVWGLQGRTRPLQGTGSWTGRVGGGVPCSRRGRGVPPLCGRGRCSRSLRRLLLCPPAVRSVGRCFCSGPLSGTNKQNQLCVEPGSDSRQAGAGSQGSPGSRESQTSARPERERRCPAMRGGPQDSGQGTGTET